MNKLIIGAPFGNWLSSTVSTSTFGTYTWENRAGWRRWWMWWRILLTLRYNWRVKAWTNKLGLPSPGFAKLHEHLLFESENHGRNPLTGNILSVHGFTGGEWFAILNAVGDYVYPEALELNVSCPNVGHITIDDSWMKQAVRISEARKGTMNPLTVIAKLPPVRYWEIYKAARGAGITTFHCCNTLPVACGGMSGKPLKNVSLDVIKRIKDDDSSVTIIGGGGITGPDDINDYHKAGADHFAVGSVFLHPKFIFRSAVEEFMHSLNYRILTLKGLS